MENTRDQLYEIIFEADTPSGKLFDLLLLLFFKTRCTRGFYENRINSV